MGRFPDRRDAERARLAAAHRLLLLKLEKSRLHKQVQIPICLCTCCTIRQINALCGDARDIEFVMATCEDRKIEVKKGVLVEFELQDTGSGTLGEATPPESQQTNG